jgi:hypothetical protein
MCEGCAARRQRSLAGPGTYGLLISASARGGWGVPFDLTDVAMSSFGPGLSAPAVQASRLGLLGLEGHDLVCPDCPVAEFFERGPVDAFDEQVVVDSSCVEACGRGPDGSVSPDQRSKRAVEGGNSRPGASGLSVRSRPHLRRVEDQVLKAREARGSVSLIRTITSRPLAAVIAATTTMAVLIEYRSATIPARTAPTANPTSRHNR